MYNYYLKYIKYKNKYLSLKGGKTPYIIDKNPIIKFLPLNYGDNIKRIIGDVKINILKIFDKDIISDFL